MSGSQKNHWAISIPATPVDPVLLAEIRPSHIAHLKSLLDAGIIVFGGPTLKEQPSDHGGPPQITGSLLIVRCGSEREVREYVNENPYVTAGIWAIEDAIVQPYILALKA